MDFSLGDLAWAFGIVVVVATVGVIAAIRSALGGGSVVTGRSVSAIGLFFRALTWRILPALTSWYERNRDYAVNRYDDRAAREGGIERSSSGMEPAIPPPVPAHQDAARTSSDNDRDDYSRQELLDILARQRADNKYVFSGNKLVELFAGSPHAASRNALLDEVARIRKSSEPEKPTPSNRSERPANGWGNAT